MVIICSETQRPVGPFIADANTQHNLLLQLLSLCKLITYVTFHPPPSTKKLFGNFKTNNAVLFEFTTEYDSYIIFYYRYNDRKKCIIKSHFSFEARKEIGKIVIIFDFRTIQICLSGHHFIISLSGLPFDIYVILVIWLLQALELVTLSLILCQSYILNYIMESFWKEPIS